MYIQITTRCNMTCEHCSFSCTNQGEDMSLETFQKALQLAGDYIQLGGGEPTIHPQFREFLFLALGAGDVWLATNGSQTETALILCKMARKGVIGCALSRDYYHDEIDWDVIEAFQDGMERQLITNDKGGRYYSDFGYVPKGQQGYGRQENEHDRREIRDVSHNISKRGRAEENELYHEDTCSCPGLMVRPNGDVHVCGCDGSPCLGNVNDENASFDMPEEYQDSECGLNPSEVNV